MSMLQDLGESIRAVAASAGPWIVGIGARHRGSGVVISSGRVLTNAHNVRGEEVTVRFLDGRTERGRVVGIDWDGDLAVIDVDTGDARPVDWSGATADTGTAVLAAAATPAGSVRVTVGFVSSVERAFRGPGGRRIGGSVEHTAPLAAGSSGSALLDADGRLLGLNTHRVGDGFYLALPADRALRDRVDALARGESPNRPRLGIAVAPAYVARRLRRSVGLPERDGLLIRKVDDSSPADAAGLREGDLLVAAGGHAVTDVDALHDQLAATSLPIELTILRGTEERTVVVGGTAAGTGPTGEA